MKVSTIKLKSLKSILGLFVVGTALLIAWLTRDSWAKVDRHAAQRAAQRISCVNNLKQIGLAVRIWSGDNGDLAPWNLSTNDGGTLELRARDKDGFDSNAVVHFQTMLNELGHPLILVCPQDKTKTPAASFEDLKFANVTYRLRTGTNITEANPKEVLAVCPVDGNTLYCNGEVVEKKHSLLEIFHSSEH